jgi:hypothetical protein
MTNEMRILRMRMRPTVASFPVKTAIQIFVNLDSHFRGSDNFALAPGKEDSVGI